MANVVEVDVRANNKTDAGFDGVKASLERSLGGLAGIAKVAGADLAASVSVPLVAASGVAVAAFASVGAAIGAFGLAVSPQLAKMTDLKADLSTMAPATREAAVGFRGLKADMEKWSESLAPKTMPVFTKGIGILRTLLPSLTPLVNAAADSLNDFMGVLQKDASGGGIQKFIAKLADAARNILPGFLMSLRNVAIGFGGVISAFLPFTTNLGSGLEKLTKKFADFGQSLGSNPAFIKFMQEAQTSGPGLLEMLGNLAKSFIAIATALAPFTGLTLVVAEAFAKLIAAIPQDVMNWLAPAIMGIVLAVKAWAVVQGILNIALLANPLGLVVVAIAGFVGAIVLAYNKSETFRNIVDGAWSRIKDSISGAWGVIRPILSKFADWFTDAKKPLSEFAGFIKTDMLGVIKDFAQGISGIGDSISKLPDSFDALKGLGGGDKDKDKKGGNKALSAISKPFIKLADTVKDIMSGLFDWLDDHWDDALDGIAKAVGTWGKAMQKLWQKPWNWIIDFASMFWALLTAITLGGIKRIGHAILSPWPGIQRAWDRHMSGLPTAAARMVVRVIQAVGRLPGRIAGIASRMWSSIPRSLSGAANAVYGILNSLAGWVSGRLASIRSSVSNAVSGIIGMIPGFAHGGITGAAGGGPRSGMTLVGEQGPELIKLPPGTNVTPAGATKNMLSGMGGGGSSNRPIQVNLNVDGKTLARVMFDPLKGEIRSRAGGGSNSVQTALS